MNVEAKKAILLVDDDPLVLASLTKLLEKAGYVVHAYQDSRHAIQDAMTEDFDLVVTDVRMPHVDGVQAIRYIREIRLQNNKPLVPEVIITGYAQEYESAAGELKVAGFLYKPFHPGEFLDVIVKALADKKA